MKFGGGCKNLWRKNACKKSYHCILVWPTSEFKLKNPISGVTTFKHSSWGDFITYDNGGHIWLHALAKNYLEISISNLLRNGLKLDHVNFGDNSDWKNLGFFMRYQEIELSAEFYDGLNCPRVHVNSNLPHESLQIKSEVSQVGSTSGKLKLLGDFLKF